MTHRRSRSPRWAAIALAAPVSAAALAGTMTWAMADPPPGQRASGAAVVVHRAVTAGERDDEDDDRRGDGDRGGDRGNEQGSGDRGFGAQPVRRSASTGAGTAELDSMLRDIERLHAQVRVLRRQVAAMEHAAAGQPGSGRQTPAPAPTTARPSASRPAQPLPTTSSTTRPAPRTTPPAPTTTRAPAATRPTAHTTTGASS